MYDLIEQNCAKKSYIAVSEEGVFHEMYDLIEQNCAKKSYIAVSEEGVFHEMYDLIEQNCAKSHTLLSPKGVYFMKCMTFLSKT